MFSSRHSLNILLLFIFILSTSQSFSETISFKGFGLKLYRFASPAGPDVWLRCAELMIPDDRSIHFENASAMP